MKTFFLHGLAGLLVISFCGCGQKKSETKNQSNADPVTASEANAAASWVSQTIPKPTADGWITLFDGERLYGCAPTNEAIVLGKVFVQNGLLWMDSMGIPFQLKSREVAFRVTAKKVSGQNFTINFGRDYGWYNGGHAFGVGRSVNNHYEDLLTGKSAVNFNDFFEMQFLAVGGKLALLADGKTVVLTQDEENNTESGMGLYALKGISMFKRIEVKMTDVQSLLPKAEPTANAQAKPAAADRLKQVKQLFDQGLINKEDYDKKVKEIVDSI